MRRRGICNAPMRRKVPDVELEYTKSRSRRQVTFNLTAPMVCMIERVRTVLHAKLHEWPDALVDSPPTNE